MKFIRSTLGYMLIGMLAASVWGVFAETYGIGGGWFAALIVIGPIWFLNHFLGLIKHDSDSAFVDMGFGIAFTALFKDFFNQGVGALTTSLPTLLLVVLGAVFGGYVAAKIEEDMEKD